MSLFSDGLDDVIFPVKIAVNCSGTRVQFPDNVFHGGPVETLPRKASRGHIENLKTASLSLLFTDLRHRLRSGTNHARDPVEFRTTLNPPIRGAVTPGGISGG